MSLPTSGLIGDFRASAGLTITGSGISQADDHSGQGNHATQPDDSLRPTYLTISGRDYMSFDGTQCLELPALTGNSKGCCIFVVGQAKEFSNEANELTVFLNDGTNNFNCLVKFNSGGQGSSQIRFRNFSTGKYVGTSLMPYGINGGTSSSTAYVGSESAVGPALETLGAAVGFSQGGLIGAFLDDDTPSFFFNGLISAVVIYDEEKTATEIEQIRDYLSSTYKCCSRTEDRFILCEGDSLTKGNAAPNEGYDEQLGRLYATEPKIVNAATGGDTLAVMMGQTGVVDTEFSRNSAYSNKLAILWAGSNDISVSGTLADLQSNATSWVAGRKALGAKVVILTTIARSDFDATKNGVRTAYNDWIKAGSSGADAVADVASDARLQDPTDTTYYRDDEVHLVAAGQSVVAGYVKAAIDSLDPVDVRLEGRYEQNTDLDGEYQTNTDIEGKF